jgi:hypothetical protein
MADSSVFVDPVDNAPAGDAFYTPPVPLPDGDRGDPVYQHSVSVPLTRSTPLAGLRLAE